LGGGKKVPGRKKREVTLSSKNKKSQAKIKADLAYRPWEGEFGKGRVFQKNDTTSSKWETENQKVATGKKHVRVDLWGRGSSGLPFQEIKRCFTRRITGGPVGGGETGKLS